ncbi:MAG: transketolase [Spirochaetaceae bacterium]|jgi:transketolase|nr:transketolase [Spirochaetaceae bacterium]
MPLSLDEWRKLEETADRLRRLCLKTVVWAHSGHIGGSLSALDALTILYHKYLKIDPARPDWEDRDRMIISKGHIGVAHAPILADKGYFSIDLIKDFNLTGSSFGIHLDSTKVPGVDCSTGSLGHGLSLAAGLGLASRLSGRNYRVFCLLGDGECNEGSVWEAAMAVAQYKLTGVITLVDHNRFMMDGAVEEVMGIEPLEDKWRSFGFTTKKINGHRFDELDAAIGGAIDAFNAGPGKPTCIILETVKGCGIDFMENNRHWHYGALDDPKVAQAEKSLDAHLAKRLQEVR